MSLKKYFKEVKNLLIFKSVFSITEGIMPYIMSKAIIEIVNIITANSIDVINIVSQSLILIISVFWQRIELTLKMPIDSLFDAKSKEYIERASCEMVRNADYESIESAEFQEQYSHIARYVNRISQLWNKVLGVITTLIQFISLTVLLCEINWYVALLLFCGALPIFIEYRKRIDDNRSFENDVQISNNKSNYYYNMMTNSHFLKEGHIFNYQPLIKERWKKLKATTIEHSYVYRKRILVRELLYRAVQYTSFIFSIIILVISSFKGMLDVGSAVGAFSAMQTYQIIVGQLFFTISEFKEIKQYQKELKLFSIKYASCNNKHLIEDAYSIQDEIKFENVFYRYKNKKDFALQNVNISIKKGETIFIVGMNGSGKSTFIKLMTGLYKPTLGDILYDGNKQTEVGNIFHNFTVLFQDYSKFPFSINENVSLGKVKNFNTNTDINLMLEKVGIDQYVNGLPERGETFLGKIKNGAINLSEGQWQKIALARALYRNSDIYIFDEPSASLDPLAESRLFELYSQIPNGKTKIIISHRLGYAKYADRIILFENGIITEQGSFDSLLNQKGAFYKMYETQKELYLK